MNRIGISPGSKISAKGRSEELLNAQVYTPNLKLKIMWELIYFQKIYSPKFLALKFTKIPQSSWNLEPWSSRNFSEVLEMSIKLSQLPRTSRIFFRRIWTFPKYSQNFRNFRYFTEVLGISPTFSEFLKTGRLNVLGTFPKFKRFPWCSRCIPRLLELGRSFWNLVEAPGTFPKYSELHQSFSFQRSFNQF